MKVVEENSHYDAQKHVTWICASRKGCNLFLAAQPDVHVPLFKSHYKEGISIQMPRLDSTMFYYCKIIYLLLLFFFFVLCFEKNKKKKNRRT
jgi:hypothetical protein